MPEEQTLSGPTTPATATTRAVRIAADRSLVVEEVPSEPVGPGTVRLRVEYCGVCGTDLHLRPSPMLPVGAIMGHEISARVEEVAGDVATYWARGDRVCVFPAVPCGECPFCRSDAPQVCPAMLTTGIGLSAHPGGYAESVVVPASTLFAIPDALSDVAAALVEPVAVALHAIDNAGLRPEDPLVVIGAGPIGVLVALCARVRGADRIVVVERNPARAERVRALGLAVVEGGEDVGARVAEQLGGAMAPLVIECAGHPAAPQLAIELVAPQGRVLLAGMLEEPVAISQFLAMVKEIEIRTAILYRPRDFHAAIEMLAAGEIPVDEFVTRIAPLDDVSAVFEELQRPGTAELKVLLRP